MMSYLYPEDEVTFDKSGFGPLPDMLESYAEEEANSYFELYFEYPLFDSHERGDYNQVYVNMSDYLIEGNQVTYKPSHSREPHAFRIYKTEKQVEKGIILVWARTRTADLRGNPVRRVISNGSPVSSALNALKMASEETHPFSFTTNIQSNISFEKNQTNVLDALAGEEDSILAITGGQMIRSNNNIYIGTNESSKNVVEFRLGKNIEGISYEVDYSNVVTAVIPFYTQTYKLVDDVRDEIVRDSKGNIVKNADGTTKYNRTVGKKREALDNEVIVYGDTVFSQYANDYSTPFYSFVEIRDDREDPGVDKDPLPPFTKTDINIRAVDWFDWEENLGIDEPEVHVTVDVHDISQSSEYGHDINLAKLETLNVFDKALVYVPEVGIDMDMEINYVRYDGVAEKNLEVRLGTTLTSLRETILSPQQRAFNQRVQQLDREIAKTAISSDGKSRVYWMATKPTGSFEIGDLWFDISLDGGIYVWDGYDWVAKLPPEFGTLIEDSVNQAIEAADLAMQEAQTKADQALLDAKTYADQQAALIKQEVDSSVNTAISTAEEAKQTAESSYTNAVAEAERLAEEQSTAFNTKFEENATAMATLSQAAIDADAKAQSALTKAGANANLLTTHQNTLNTINNTTIPNLNSSISDAMGTAQSALSSANSALDEAQTALSSAGSAMDEAKKADGKIADYVTRNGLVSGTTVDNKIDEATGEISRKITTVESKVDGLKIGVQNLVPNSEEQIWSWATQLFIASKASKLFKPNTKYAYRWELEVASKIPVANANDLDRRMGGYIYSGSNPAFSEDIREWYKNSNVGDTKLIQGTFTTSSVVDNPFYVYGVRNNSTNTNSTIRVKRILIAESDVLISDWVPAPEDNYTQEEFAIFENNYREDVKGINTALTELSNSKVDGTTYTNFYNNEYKQTAQGVTDTYTKLNKIIDANGNSTDTFAKAVYDRNATRQTAAFSEVTKDLVTEATYTSGINGVTESIRSVRGDINSLGARNYFIRKEENVNKCFAWSSGAVGPESGSITSDLIEVKEGDTFSSYPRVSQVGFYDINKNYLGSLSGESSLTKVSGSTYDKFTVPSGENIYFMRVSYRYNIMDGITLDELKVMLNKGNITLDWTPAPEESLSQKKFDVFESEIKRDVTGETGRLTRVEGVASTAKSTADSAKSTAETAKSTFDNFYTKEWEETASHSQTAYEAITKKDTEGDDYIVRSATYKQGIKGVSESITSLEGAIYNGSENYWVNSAFRQGDSGWGNANIIRSVVGQPDVLNYGDAFVRIDSSWNDWIDLYEVPRGEFIISADVGTIDSGGRGTLRFAIRMYTDETNFTVVNDYVPFTNYTLRNGRPMIRIKTKPFQVPSTTIKVRIYLLAGDGQNIDATRFKLEKGKTATAWSPSYQDMLGSEVFKLFKTNYERDDKAIKTELGMIDSGKEGTVAYKTNQALNTANGNSTLISTIDKNYVKQSDIDESILVDKKIKDTRSTNQLPPWYFTNYPSQEVREFKQVSTMGAGSGNFGILTTNVPWSGSSGGTVKQSFETNTETYVRQSNSAGTAWGTWSKQVDTADTTYQKIVETSSLYERVLGSTNEDGVKSNISRIVQTSEIIQQEITRSGDKNVIPYWETGRIRWADGEDAEVTDGVRTGYIYREPKRNTEVNTSNMYTFSNDGVKTSVYVFRYYANGNFYDYSFVSSFTLTDAVPYARLVVQGGSLINKYQLELGTEATYYVAPSSKNMSSTITQLAGNINLKVSKSDLISEINVSTEGVRIAGKNIQLDGNIYMTSYFQVPDANIKDLAVNKITGTTAQFTTMVTKGLTADVITSTMIKADTALFNMLFSTTSATTRLSAQDAWIKSANISTLDASKITSGTIAAARINAALVVSSGLVTDVVKSTHIQGDTALIDKVFATTALIQRLTSKTAFISSIQAISISATKITSGTLDASKVTVTNIDASNITANKTSFVQSVWNSLESSISINSTGLLSKASDNSQVYLQNGIVGARNPSGATIGQIGYAYESSSPWYSMQVSYGSHFQIRMSRGDGQLNKQAFYIIAGGTESYLNTDDIYFNPVNWATVQGRFRTQGETRIDAQLYVSERINFSTYGGYIRSQSNSNLQIYASNNLVVYAKGSNALEIDATHAVFRRQISENSDARLKTNIVDMPIDSLEAIRNLEIKKFDYLDGRLGQYGIIAQQAQNYLPELIDVDSEGYLMVNKSAMTYINMHAIQQLDKKFDTKVIELEHKIATLQKELATLKGD